MTQRAYLEVYDKWEDELPSGCLKMIEDTPVIELDTAKLSVSEVDRLRSMQRKRQRQLFCAVCQTRLIYNRGFFSVDEDGVRKNRSPFFRHLKRDCFQTESLEHALTKRFIFDRLTSADYLVFENKRPSGAQMLRADVAAYQTKENLKLVVEVLATPPRVEAMKRKINTFFELSVPTAWILLLDTFYGRGGVISGGLTGEADMSQAGEITYKRSPIEPGIKDNFVIKGSDHKAFSFLLNHYGYAIGIFLPGYVFLIQRDNTNEEERYLKLLRGQVWDPADDVYMITRMADKDILPLLLNTPLRQFEVLSASVEHLAPGIPGEINSQDKHLDRDEQIPDEAVSIDFEAHKLIGQEADLAFNPLQLIQEQRLARERAERRYSEEKALEANSGTAKPMEFPNGKIEATQVPVKSAPPWLPTPRLLQAEQRDYLLHALYLHGLGLVHPAELGQCSEEEGLQLLDTIEHKRIKYAPVQLKCDEDTITTAFKSLSEPERVQMERNLFPDGSSDQLWYFTMADRQRRLEFNERKKQEQKERRQKR